MIVFLNGKFIPEEKAQVSVFDRGFLYGDGLFETLRIYNGQLFRWEKHWERFRRGAEFLKIKIPFSLIQIEQFVAQLIAENKMPEAILRMNLSRGRGLRGYSPKGTEQPTFVLSLPDAPKLDGKNPVQWRLATSSFRVQKNDPLTAIKNCNKLVQIMAREEAESKGADEALILNEENEIAEATTANFFWIEDEKVFTPPLANGALPGVTRSVVKEVCELLKISFAEKSIARNKLNLSEGIFLTSTSFEIIEVILLDNRDAPKSPLTKRIARAYCEIILRETGGFDEKK